MESLSYYLATGEPDTLSWFQQNAAWIALLLGPIGVLIGIYMTRRTGKETVNVNEKDANTRAVASVVEALSEGLSELRQEVKEQKEKNVEDKTESDERIRCLEEEVDALRRGREALLVRLGQVVTHLAEVEAMVPNPPGAPPRPVWKEITELPADDEFN